MQRFYRLLESIYMVLIFIVLLSGYLLSRVTLKSRSLAVAFSPFLGTIVMVGIGYLYWYQPPTDFLFLWLLFIGLVVSVVWIEGRMKAIRTNDRWEHLAFVVLGGLLSFVSINNRLCADETTHAYLIKQIQLNNWPLKGLFPGGVLVKYHYGFDGVVAMVSSILHVEYVYVIKGIMLSISISLFYGVSYLLKTRGLSIRTRLYALFILFAFSGLSTFTFKAHWFSIYTLITVPSSMFVIGLVIWYLLLLSKYDVKSARRQAGLVAGILCVIGRKHPLNHTT